MRVLFDRNLTSHVAKHSPNETLTSQTVTYGRCMGLAKANRHYGTHSNVCGVMSGPVAVVEVQVLP
jgi:hypothetical protein